MFLCKSLFLRWVRAWPPPGCQLAKIFIVSAHYMAHIKCVLHLKKAVEEMLSHLHKLRGLYIWARLTSHGQTKQLLAGVYLSASVAVASRCISWLVSICISQSFVSRPSRCFSTFFAGQESCSCRCRSFAFPNHFRSPLVLSKLPIWLRQKACITTRLAYQADDITRFN